MNIRLICIQTYHAHWAGHSGYHHFLDHLPGEIHVTHERIARRRVGSDELRGMEKVWFRPAVAWAKGRVNSWTSENDLLAEFRLLQQVRDGLKAGEKTVVHFLDGEIGYNFTGSLLQYLGRKSEKVRLLASYHQPGDILGKVLYSRERIKKLDMVLTVGTSQLSFFDYMPRKRVIFMPHGIDTDYFRPAEKFANNKEKVFCLTVGHWLRDFDSLEQVICNSPRQVVFRIVAGEEHVRRFQPLPNVELYSGVGDDKLLRLYQSSDIGLMPLQDSTANNGLLEMISCGLPVISTHVGSVPDYLPEGTGILLDRNSPSIILKALERLVDLPGERLHLGEAARNRALELNWPNIASMMAEVYEEV